MMTRFLSLFCLLVVLGLSGPAFASGAGLEQTVVENPNPGVLGPDGTTVQPPSPGCAENGEFARAYRANAARGYYQAVARVEQAFSKAVPVPATMGNCLQNIFNSVLGSFGGFSWPPDWQGLLNSFINNLMNRLCRRLWQSIANSAWVANYNSVVNGFNVSDPGRCAANLQNCRPIQNATNDLLSTLTDF